MKKSELVFIRGEYKADATGVQFNPEKQKYLVDFGKGKKYPYNKENCVIVSGDIIEVTDDSVVYVKGTKLMIAFISLDLIITIILKFISEMMIVSFALKKILR